MTTLARRLVHGPLSPGLLFPGLLVAAPIALWLSLPSAAVQIGGQEPPPPEAANDGITVTAVGSAPVEPDTVSVRLRVRSRAKSVTQALADFKAKSSLLEKAVADFDDVGATLVRGGVVVGLKSQDPNNFIMDSEPADVPFEASEAVTVSFPASPTAVDTVAELIEAATDVDSALDEDTSQNPYVIFYGMQGNGPAAPVSFAVAPESLAKARDAAFVAAFVDAQQQARSLALAAGRTIGPAESIRVVKPFPHTTKTSGAARREVELTVRFGLQ